MELEVGKNYNVKVVKIIKVGAIVELEDQSTELIHLSNISNQFVDDVSNFVIVGSTYIATCQKGKAKPIELTLRPLDLKRLDSNTAEKSESLNITCGQDEEHEIEKPNSLDDMIANMNAVYQDNMKAYNRDRYNRRKRKTRRDY